MTKRGFTLIEIMVAISIFAIVAVIATGALLTANRVNQKAQAVKLAMDNLNFALDSMVFRLRRGGSYHCIPDAASLEGQSESALDNNYPELTSNNCTGGDGGGEAISSWLLGSGNHHSIYRLAYDDEGRGRLEVWQTGQTSWLPMTLPELNLQDLNFYVSDPTGGAVSAFITLKGELQIGTETSRFALQTLVSERR